MNAMPRDLGDNVGGWYPDSSPKGTLAWDGTVAPVLKNPSRIVVVVAASVTRGRPAAPRVRFDN